MEAFFHDLSLSREGKRGTFLSCRSPRKPSIDEKRKVKTIESSKEQEPDQAAMTALTGGRTSKGGKTPAFELSGLEGRRCPHLRLRAAAITHR